MGFFDRIIKSYESTKKNLTRKYQSSKNDLMRKYQSSKDLINKYQSTKRYLINKYKSTEREFMKRQLTTKQKLDHFYNLIRMKKYVTRPIKKSSIPSKIGGIRKIVRRENFQKINPAIFNTPNPETISNNLKIVQTNINNFNTFIVGVLTNKINNTQITHLNLDNSNSSIELKSIKSCEDYMSNTLEKQANLVILDLNKLNDVVSMGLIKNSYNPIKILFNQNYNTIDNNLKNYTNVSSSQQSILPTQPTQPTTVGTSSTQNSSLPIQTQSIPTYTAPVVSKLSVPDPQMITLQNYYSIGRTNEGFENYISPSYINTMPIIEGLNDTNEIAVSNIMKKEQELANQLNDFNKKYELYIECNDGIKKTSQPSCSNVATKTDLINQMNIINDNIKIIDDNIKLANSNSNFKYSDYTDNYYNVMNNYKSVKTLRNELDEKVNRLYNPEKSMISDYGYTLDSTIYSGILISALATSILYYIFTEL